jgi:thioredoxin-related protein
MLKRYFLLFFAAFVFGTALKAQQPDAEGGLVKWMTLSEAMEKVKTQPRPIIMDFYTDWCGWCKQMMRTTYANPDVAQYLNANFYPVKFNAETRETIEYLGQKYAPVDTSKKSTSTLAIKLLQNKLMYPTTLFLNNFDSKKNDFAFSMLAQGYLDDKKFEPMLIFTLENAFHNSNYEDFKAQYDIAFFDTATDGRLKKLNWLKPKEAFNNQTSAKKKTLVLIHTDWCNACKVEMRTDFSDTLTKKYLSEKFNIVDFDPQITDTITFKGQTYVNPRSPQMPFHQLAVALCRNSITLPSLVFMDEQMNVIDAVPFYITPQVLKNIATFYGDDVYKTKSWNDFMAGLNKEKEKESVKK